MMHETFEVLLLEYLDDALSKERRQALEEYLREHPDERLRVRQHEALDRLLGELAEETALPSSNGSVARVTRAVKSLPAHRRGVSARWWLAAAAAGTRGATRPTRAHARPTGRPPGQPPGTPT